MTRTDLIAALKEARDGSAGLDARIGLYVGDWKVGAGRAIFVRDDHGTWCWAAQSSEPSEESAIKAIATCLSLRPFTRSIDAALTLLPEDREWSVAKCVEKGQPIYYEAIISLVNLGDTLIVVEAATPALAVCLAALEYDE